ncbi:hypothetical protein TREPR_2782 [Treponema primitia ZAS-2]|uniref:Uncharacterized protein n=1 Tax=Treponema primitia (strain ATCC BAA-887 / DSM 12427 / ZAS-2) TaxID=545694 RepID=F5YQ05_TREPZ|nr:hypothetical protein [Treponema primitia]AEF84831.1 hypothetical protein TREPR_2782 [Treponema primitia ZAS-2]
MKRALFLSTVLIFTLAGLAFGADTFTVKSFSGKVDQLEPSGQWVSVSVGGTLSASTTVKLGLNSILVVVQGDQESTIRAARQGTLESLLSAGTGGGKISVGGTVTNSTVEGNAQGVSNIPTATSRAGDTAADLDWVK